MDGGVRACAGGVQASSGLWLSAGVPYAGSSEAEMIVLSTHLGLCRTNDPCREGCARQLVSFAVRASQSFPNNPPTGRMAALQRGKPSVALPLLCCLLLASVFCLRNARMCPVQKRRGCSRAIFGITASLSLLIVIAAEKYQGEPLHGVTLSKGDLAKPEEQT